MPPPATSGLTHISQKQLRYTGVRTMGALVWVLHVHGGADGDGFCLAKLGENRC
jgi:hypothetical protein